MGKLNFLFRASLIALLFLGGCTTYESRNEFFVKRLSSQMRAGNFRDIYDESSEKAKDVRYSREQFIERLRATVERMREVDASLQMQKHQGDFPWADPGAFPPSQYEYRYVEGGGKRLGINITFDSNTAAPVLLDLCVYTENDGTSLNPAEEEFCLSDASKS